MINKWKTIKIEAFDLNDLWFQLLRDCLKYGYEWTIQRGSFEGHKRKEFDNVSFVVFNPSNLPIIPDVPEGIPPPTSMKYVNNYLAYLVTPEKKPEEQYTYGERISTQISKIIEMLKKTPMTNQACIEVARPEDINLKDPPCLRLLDFRVRYGALHMFCYFRSWDLWAGLPANLAGLQLLKEYMARQIGIKDGTLNGWSKGLHLYDHQWELAKQVVFRKTGRRMVVENEK